MRNYKILEINERLGKVCVCILRHRVDLRNLQCCLNRSSGKLKVGFFVAVLAVVEVRHFSTCLAKSRVYMKGGPDKYVFDPNTVVSFGHARSLTCQIHLFFFSY